MEWGFECPMDSFILGEIKLRVQFLTVQTIRVDYFDTREDTKVPVNEDVLHIIRQECVDTSLRALTH